MRNLKNRVESFDLFVRLDEQLDTTANDNYKMLKSKLKSVSYNASSAISMMESNPGVMIEAYIIAKIAVAAEYLDSIEEYFRNYESDGASALPAVPMTSPGDSIDMGTEEGSTDDEDMDDMEDMDDTEDEMPASADDETEDEVEDSPEEE